jgi:hypothetical protein
MQATKKTAPLACEQDKCHDLEASLIMAYGFEVGLTTCRVVEKVAFSSANCQYEAASNRNPRRRKRKMIS